MVCDSLESQTILYRSPAAEADAVAVLHSGEIMYALSQQVKNRNIFDLPLRAIRC